MTEVEVTAKIGDQGSAVGGTGLTPLLKLHDIMPDLPEGSGEMLVDRTVSLKLTVRVNRRNAVNQGLIAGIGSQLDVTHSRGLSGLP
jgi:hypothetical protein